MKTARGIVLGACYWALFLDAGGAEFKFPTQTLTVPDGFEVELAALPPLTDRPIIADFDEQGRLYVAESSGSNDKVDQQLKERPHRIVRLEDSDRDGRFDTSVVFADKMMFPEGCLWYRGSLYVSAPPSIWKLTDSDGDGVADQRQEWLPAKTLTGCANDLHGPYAGPDGWLYWCKGAFASQTYTRLGKAPFVSRAAHIFRARPDGSDIEPVLTGGMDNPVSIAFTPGGERILTGTFFVHPGGGQRDGLIHAIYGGVYGKDHDVLDGHPRTGDLMPIMTHHGPSASCYVLRYESAAFGREYRDNLFACLFNLHKVTRHILVPDGATFTTRDEDFLVSDNPDFHPTNLIEDADGSLLVVDTGGWYKLCCPTSQLWKPDVLGAIYRVRKVGAPKLEDPRGLRIAWSQGAPENHCQLLGDARLAVRNRAMEQLAQLGPSAVPALRTQLAGGQSSDLRRNAVWTLTRIEGRAARAAVREALADPDPAVQLTAAHSISLWRDGAALDKLLELVGQGTAPLQRVAAEALGRIGDSRAVPALLHASAVKSDRVLEHSLTYALIEIGDPAAVRETVAHLASSPYARRSALIALDQMAGGNLTPGQIVPLLASTDPVLKETAAWITAHHPEWAGALAGFFRERLRDGALGESDRAQLERQLSDFARDPAIQQVLAEVLQLNGGSAQNRVSALRAMQQSRVKELPECWAGALRAALDCPEPTVLAKAVATARALPLPKQSAIIDALRGLARDARHPAEVRLNALAAVPGGLAQVEPRTFEFLLAQLDSSQPVLTRGTAADVLAKARLGSDQLAALTEGLKSVGPLELPKLLGAFEKAPDETVGLKLIEALRQSSGLVGLRPEVLKPRLTNFPARVQQQGEELLASLNVDAAKQRAHLDALLDLAKGGDVRRGQAVFNSQRAACSSCHAIGYLGGTVGPDLTRIGQVRTERDLLEAIVYPSASFVRSYEPVVVTTKSGDDFSGVIRKDAPDELVLATGPGTEVLLSRSEITDVRPGAVSVMPGGLEEQLSREELADLMAFLKATRW